MASVSEAISSHYQYFLYWKRKGCIYVVQRRLSKVDAVVNRGEVLCIQLYKYVLAVGILD